jgi:hypothetical protein
MHRKWYLFIIFKDKPWLGSLVFFFILGQFFFSFKGIQTLPFFNFGMYAAPYKSATVYTVNELWVWEEGLCKYYKPNLTTRHQFSYYQEHKDLAYPAIYPTIEKRFGPTTSITNFLKKQYKEELFTYPVWLSTRLKVDSVCIKTKTYRYDSAEPEKVRSNER